MSRLDDPLSVVCRVCTEQTPPEVASNLFESRVMDGLSLAEVVALVGNIMVLADEEGFPAWCCFQCQLDVEMAYRVRLLCQESDRKLREMLLESVYPEGEQQSVECKMEIEEPVIGSTESTQENHKSDKNDETEDDLVEVLKPSRGEQKVEEDHFEGQDSDVFEEIPCLKVRCCGCYQFFDTRQDLLNHGKSEHAVADPPEGAKNMKLCEICFQLVRKKYLQRHQQTPRTMFRCKECGELFINERKVCTHHLMSHYSYQTCCACDIKFDSVEALREHSDQMHLPNKLPTDKYRPFVCNVCYLNYKTSSHLYAHRISKGSKRYQCSQCELSFRGPMLLKRHETCHRDPKAFRCPICAKTYASFDSLRLHIPNHRPSKSDLFKCALCKKGYRCKLALKQHMVVAHGFQGKFQCQSCPSSFMRKAHLIRHRERFHMAKVRKVRKARARQTKKNTDQDDSS